MRESPQPRGLSKKHEGFTPEPLVVVVPENPALPFYITDRMATIVTASVGTYEDAKLYADAPRLYARVQELAIETATLRNRDGLVSKLVAANARVQKLESALRDALQYIPDGCIPVMVARHITEALNREG